MLLNNDKFLEVKGQTSKSNIPTDEHNLDTAGRAACGIGHRGLRLLVLVVVIISVALYGCNFLGQLCRW